MDNLLDCLRPVRFLLVQLTQEKASEHSRKRLDRTFRCSPEIAKRLSPRKNDNNVHDKYFRAGNLLKIGWPSINVLSSSDYKYVALTDYDRWPDDVDGEGDGFSLASKRTTTFMSAGMTLVESSPGKDIVDLKHHPKSTHEAPPTTGILSLYNRGDRRRFTGNVHIALIGLSHQWLTWSAIEMTLIMLRQAKKLDCNAHTVKH